MGFRRITVSVNEDYVHLVDVVSRRFGISRSSVISFLVGRGAGLLEARSSGVSAEVCGQRMSGQSGVAIEAFLMKILEGEYQDDLFGE